MDYIHTEKFLNSGNVVRVTLDKQANVLLLDDNNYSNYRNRRQYTYFGGLAKVSPIDITVPHTGNWHIVINLGGAKGQIKYSISVL